MGKLIVKKSHMVKLHFVCQSKRFSSLLPDQNSSNWRPLLKFYSPKCFSTRHGDRNGRSLERCPYISYGTSKENLSKYQDILSQVITFFNCIT